MTSLAFIEFESLSVAVNFAIFAGAAAAVWFAGAKLSRYVDVIADRTGIGTAFAGLLLLGGATSLPELATTVSAAWTGAPELAASNLVGGVAMQTAMLAVADLFVVRGALTFFTPRAVLLVHAIMLIVLLALVMAAAATGEMLRIGHVGVWTIAIAATYVASLYSVHRYEKRQAWEPVNPPEQREDAAKFRELVRASFDLVRTAGLAARFAAVAAVVTLGGWLVAGTAHAITEQTGLEANFVGATLVAISTSLPELSTTISAVRLGAYSMAVSNIFGSNAICISLLLPADIAWRGGAIVESLDHAAIFIVALGIVLTCIYLWGLLERGDRSVLGLGIDSAIVVALYAAGLVALYLAPWR